MGATTPEGYGDYFAWGETQPKDTYNWSTYAYATADADGDLQTLTKYNTSAYYGTVDNLTVLQPGDDAATANWGSGWHTPTQEQWWELYENTANIWTAQNGAYGRLFTASNGNSLFLPAAGGRWDDNLLNAGNYGRYWSSSLYTDYPIGAWYLYFYSDLTDMGGSYRCYGLSVRAVRSAE